MTRKIRRMAGTVLASAVLGATFAAATADAYIYTTCQQLCGGSNNLITRHTTAGGPAGTEFIKVQSGLIPTGIAIDARNVYWAALPSGAGDSVLGRGTIDEAGNLIPGETNQQIVTGLKTALGVAAYAKPDGTTFVYWVNGGTNSIGRVEFGPDGEVVGTPDSNFITGATDAFGLTFADGVLYWSRWLDNDDNDNTPHSFIGSAEIGTDGLAVAGTVNQSYITGVESPNGVTADDGHVYWGNDRSSWIGRASFDEDGVIDPLSIDNGWAKDGPIPFPGDFSNLENKYMYKPGGLANDGAYLYYTSRDLALFDARADDIGRLEIADPFNTLNPSFFQGNQVNWGIAVQRDSTTAINCPTGEGTVVCTATVHEIANPQPETPAGQVKLSSKTAGGSYPDGNTCQLVPSATVGISSCSVAYSRAGRNGELMTALYTGSAEHGASTISGPLLPVPFVPPPDDDPLPDPDGSGGGGAGGGGGSKNGSGSDGGGASGKSSAKKCKKKKSKKARKKCKKKKSSHR